MTTNLQPKIQYTRANLGAGPETPSQAESFEAWLVKLGLTVESMDSILSERAEREKKVRGSGAVYERHLELAFAQMGDLMKDDGDGPQYERRPTVPIAEGVDFMVVTKDGWIQKMPGTKNQVLCLLRNPHIPEGAVRTIIAPPNNEIVVDKHCLVAETGPYAPAFMPSNTGRVLAIAVKKPPTPTKYYYEG